MKEATIFIKAREDGTVLVASEISDVEVVAIVFSMALAALRNTLQQPVESTTVH